MTIDDDSRPAEPASEPAAPDPNPVSDADTSLRRLRRTGRCASRKDVAALRARLAQLVSAHDRLAHTVAEARLAVAHERLETLESSHVRLSAALNRDERIGLLVIGLLVAVAGLVMAWRF